MTNILANHMREHFSKLSPLLQKAHTGNKTLSGYAEVTRGNGIAKVICALFNFPKSSSKSKLIVHCFHSDTLMKWHRNFDGLVMNSSFTKNGEFLTEHLGLLSMDFRAEEIDGSLHYQFIKTRFLGVPMPNFLSPHIIANEKEVDGEYSFTVYVKMFLIGKVIAYKGNLILSDYIEE